VGAPPAAGGEDSFYQVTWAERGPDGERQDSTRIQARSAQHAMQKIRDSLTAMGREVTRIEANETDAPPWRQRSAGAGTIETLPNTSRNPDANWAIARKHNNEIVIPFSRNTQEEAEEYFRDWIHDRIGDPSQYKLVQLEPSTRQQALARELEQLADVYSQAMDDARGEWTGRWLIRNANTGELLHAIHGIGNSQSDANRHAQRWVQQTRFDDPVEVVPEMQ
jgi:hypothetical protein